jgi:hypothetical protein
MRRTQVVSEGSLSGHRNKNRMPARLHPRGEIAHVDLGAEASSVSGRPRDLHWEVDSRVLLPSHRAPLPHDGVQPIAKRAAEAKPLVPSGGY